MEESNINPQQITLEKTNAYYLPALTGIRFFAIFHIFMFHLVSLYGSEKPDGKSLFACADHGAGNTEHLPG